jgi:hypothetical protein
MVKTIVEKLDAEKTKDEDSILLAELINHYNESDKYLEPFRDADFSWDDREGMLVGVLNDAGSTKTKSKVNTQDLTNLILDGASRVMAQFPTGTIQAINTKQDKGKNILMNLVHEKYIVPNADSQYDFLTKLRIWDIYSRVFGSMPALIDYRVDDDYIGPDMWIIHPRSFFPQAGCTNISEMAYAQVSTWVDIEFLKNQNKSVWKNLGKLIKKTKEAGSSKQQQDSKRQPLNTRLNGDLQPETGEFAQCELLTEYRRDRWITYSKEHDLVVRDIKNPQNNNELPIVMKHCFPLLDRLYGLAEFERGYTLQYAANSLVNLYMDGVQMSIFPPLIIDQNGVVASSIEYKAKAKWLITKQGAISQLQLTPQGLNTFNSTYSFIKAQMLNLGATTDTSVSKDVDPGKGKTPEALKQQAAREGARDNWDRFMMEQALEKINQKFIDLLTTKQEKSIDITLFKDDIDKIKKSFPDEDLSSIFNGELQEFESKQAGKITVSADNWKENMINEAGQPILDKDGKEQINTIKFKYLIDAGSTMKNDDESEHSSLTDIIGLILKFPDALPQIEQSGKFIMGDKTFDFGEAMKRYVITSGIQDGEKIISDNKDNPENQQQEQNSQIQIQQITQQIQQMMEIIAQITDKIEKDKEKKTVETLQYKDAPESVKRQIEAEAGYTPGHEFKIKEGEDPVQAGMANIDGMNNIGAPVPEINKGPLPQ